MKQNVNGKVDLSVELFQKYFSHTNKEIKIVLKNKSILNGIFIGFFKGDEDSMDSYISKWHFTHTGKSLGTDTFGYLEGQIIYQKDIAKITFTEDNTFMIFEN